MRMISRRDCVKQLQLQPFRPFVELVRQDMTRFRRKLQEFKAQEARTAVDELKKPQCLLQRSATQRVSQETMTWSNIE